MKFLVVTLATCLALHSTCSQAGRISNGDNSIIFGDYSEPVIGCLKDLNNDVITGITLGECISRCSAATSFPCNSIDYNTKLRKCHLSAESKKSRPHAYHEPCYIHSTVSLYMERKGMPYENKQKLYGIMKNLTRVQRAEIQVLQRLQQHYTELIEDKNAQLALHVAENAKLTLILNATEEFCGLLSTSSELESEQQFYHYLQHEHCSIGQTYEDGNCYLVVSTPATWRDAQRDCTNRNGTLASIHDRNTNFFIGNIAGGGNSRSWIGASDAETEGVWKWTTGDIVTYNNWDNGEPNNYRYPNGNTQNCAVINFLETAKWDDYDCEIQRPYVCQGQKLSKVCESGWRKYEDSCYKVFPEVITSYESASKKCSSVQANVATLETPEENDFVKSILELEKLPYGRDIWLSGRRQNEDSPYVWGTGRQLLYSDWQPGQPYENSLLCMQIVKNDNPTWQWRAEGCTNTVLDDNGVICEKAAY